MDIVRNKVTLVTFTAALLCMGNPGLAFAADGDTATAASVPLRGEIAMQYSQANGSLRGVGGDAEVCVASTTFESVPTGNVDGGALHCHSRLMEPAHLGVQLNEEKVDVAVASVGDAKVGLKGIVDTGSGGVTLNAFQVFPASMVSPSGFNFNGKDRIVYKGITVTKLVATRSYGLQSSEPTSRTGNLGFAHLSFGEDGKLRTAMVPILFVYTSTDQPSATTGDLDNTIGINGAMAPIGSTVTYNGQPAGSETGTTGMVEPECTPMSTSACSLISPFRALSYRDGLQAGYILRSFPLVEGQKGKYLTVGLDRHDTDGYSSVQLQCATASLEVDSCNQEVRNVHVMSSGGLNFTWNVIFDSGRATVGITVPTEDANPPGTALLPAGESFTVTPPTQTGYEYSFTTGSGFATTTVTYINSDAQNAGETYSNMGLEFFATNSLMLDYDKGIEGWKQARKTAK